MADSKVAKEADRLQAILMDEGLEASVLEGGFKDFSAAAKDEVAARVAATFAPAAGRLLARLSFIRTAENGPALRFAYVASLRSPDPAARKFALYGLKALGDPALADLALVALRDDQDPVLAAAVEILAAPAAGDRRLWSFLQGFYLAHKGRDEFHMSTSLIEAHGIVGPFPDKKK